MLKGPWRWYVGEDENCSDMMQADSYAHALELGSSEYDEAFYVIEARLSFWDHRKMERGEIEWAKFVAMRDGHWIDRGAKEADNE